MAWDGINGTGTVEAEAMLVVEVKGGELNSVYM